MEYPSLDTAKAGAIRFNTDSSQMEIYDGNQWTGILATSPELQTGGGRGVFFSGAPSNNAAIDFINISTTGNAGDFGDLAGYRVQGAAAGSRTRGLYAGGEAPSIVNTIEFITFSSQGTDAQDFGDMVTNQYRRMNGMGCGNQTRGLFSGGWTGSVTSNHIDYVTIAQTGNSVDFGDLQVKRESGSCCASQTRGIISNGRNQPANVALGSIEFVTISTLGNGSNFGDITVTRFTTQSCSNSTRGLTFGGSTGNPSPSNSDVIDFITIATLGDAIDFGDLAAAIQYPLGAVASPVRAVCAGGLTPSAQNVIQYVQIMSKGDAIDFGDLQHQKSEASGCSNSHGGL